MKRFAFVVVFAVSVGLSGVALAESKSIDSTLPECKSEVDRFKSCVESMDSSNVNSKNVDLIESKSIDIANKETPLSKDSKTIPNTQNQASKHILPILPECKSEVDRIEGCIKKTYRGNGRLWYETIYKNGKENGIHREYYENGKLMKEVPVKDNMTDGIVTSYHYDDYYATNLVVICKTTMKDSVFIDEICYDKEGNPTNGVLRRYYNKGQLMWEIPYKDGRREGMSISYYSNGNLWDETPYKNGKIDGIKRDYYQDGSLESESLFKNDEIDGIWKMYYEDGKLKGEIPYKDGKKEGIEKSYRENGNLESETPYRNDKREGMERKYYDDGNLKVEILYTNDVENGVMKWYREDGSLHFNIIYENGAAIRGICINSEGEDEEMYYNSLAEFAEVGLDTNAIPCD